MTTTTRINSELTNGRRTRARRTDRPARRHQLPRCESTGLARYRDRHQARDGARSLARSERPFEVHPFACPDCNGYHLETITAREPITVASASEPAEAYTASLGSRKRRYWLVDIENPTHGANATSHEAAHFWSILTQQAPGIAPHDHVVVGASRSVARKYRAAIHGPNVKWVVGANAPDGADRALLAAIDLRRVAQNFDELVILSGDHTFAGLAHRAKTLGLTVHVITTEHATQRTMLSRELAAAADTRTLVRLQPRTLARDNLTAIQQVARASHPRTHIAAAAA